MSQEQIEIDIKKELTCIEEEEEFIALSPQEVEELTYSGCFDWRRIPWTCYYCLLVFPNYKCLRDHIQSVHRIVNSAEIHYQCSTCKSTSKSYAAYLNHLRCEHFDALKLCCDVCNKVLLHYNSLAQHRDFHVEHHSRILQPIIHHCTLCHLVYATENDLKRHTQNVHCATSNSLDIENSLPIFRAEELKPKPCEKEPDFRCAVCLETFPCEDDLKVHLSKNPGEHSGKCNICGIYCSTKLDLAIHVGSHSTFYPHSCRFCKQRFKTEKTLEEHLRKSCTSVYRHCLWCPQKFTVEGEFLNHMKTCRHRKGTANTLSSKFQDTYLQYIGVDTNPTSASLKPFPLPTPKNAGKNRVKRKAVRKDDRLLKIYRHFKNSQAK